MDEDRTELTFEVTITHAVDAGRPSPDADDVTAALYEGLEGLGNFEIAVSQQ